MFEGRGYTSVHNVQSSVYKSIMHLYIGLLCSKVEATLAFIMSSLVFIRLLCTCI